MARKRRDYLSGSHETPSQEISFMKISFKKIINSTEYIVEFWGRFHEEKYKFGIQAYSGKGKIYPFAGWVSIEFIEDEIDNNKNLNYLEKVLRIMAEDHIEDMINLNRYAVATNLKWWMKEAKEKLKAVKNNG